MARADTITLLIAAMGGEGGGVLTNWIVAAAEACGHQVQSTSIPGVAQRTGATSYYIEMTRMPAQTAPIFALAPMAGDVDIMLATEFLEAGRAIATGFVTPDKTLLIASTHRVLAIGEKSAMGDGRFDMGRLFRAAREQSAAAILFDMDEGARHAGSVLNAVLLGALAASGRLPIDATAFEAAIRADGRAVSSNLSGFRFGFAEAAGEGIAAIGKPSPTRRAPEADIAAEVDRIVHPAARDFAREGVKRLVDYQDAAYARLYLTRLVALQQVERDAGGDGRVAREVARHLAVRMSYEDIVRVADVKSSPDRMAQVAEEASVGDNPHRIVEYFKPGIEEAVSILPPALARRIIAFSTKRGWLEKAYLGMELHTNSISGYLRLRFLARLRRMRPKSFRFLNEQAEIESWLALIAEAVRRDVELALEIAELARLVKGYGDTLHRGLANYRLIVADVVRPALAGTLPLPVARDAVASARTAALADPEGSRLTDTIAEIAARTELRQAAE